MTKRSHQCLELWLKFPEEMDRLYEYDWKDNLGLLPEAEREELEKMVVKIGEEANVEAGELLGDLREQFRKIIKDSGSYKYKKGTKEENINQAWYFDIPVYPENEERTDWIMTLGCRLLAGLQTTEIIVWIWGKGSSADKIKDNLQDIVIDPPEGWKDNRVAVIARALVARDACDNFAWDKALEEITTRIRELIEKDDLFGKLYKICQ